MGTTPKNTKLQRIVSEIKFLMSPIQVNFLYVLCGNIEATGNMENQEINFSPRHIKTQGQVHFTSPSK
jgi:hypothetical protein